MISTLRPPRRWSPDSGNSANTFPSRVSYSDTLTRTIPKVIWHGGQLRWNGAGIFPKYGIPARILGALMWADMDG